MARTAHPLTCFVARTPPSVVHREPCVRHRLHLSRRRPACKVQTVAERERARRSPWRGGSPVNAPTRDVTPTWTPAGVLEGAPASTLAQLQTAVGNRGFSSLVAAHVQRQVAVD